MCSNPVYRHTVHGNKSDSAYSQSLKSSIFVSWQANLANSFHRRSPTFVQNYPSLFCQNSNRGTLQPYQVTYKISNLRAQDNCDFEIATNKNKTNRIYLI